MVQLVEGDFIVVMSSRELGLVKSITPYGKVRAWFHTGGTTALIDPAIVMAGDMFMVTRNTFSNEYAKGSIMERRLRLVNEDGPVDDLIDDHDVRESVREIIYYNKQRMIRG